MMIFPRNWSHYSYKTAALASVLPLLFLLALAPKAQAAGEYGIDNITVDATGKDATDARAKAIAMGEQDAFKQLVTQKNPAQAAQIIAKTRPSQIDMMVRGYEVVDEKMAADHYHATLRYNFDPAQMQALLGAPSAPAAAAASPSPPAAPANASKAILVLPVYNTGAGLELWQDDNKWRSIWYDAALESGGGMVIAPQGDLNDRVDVDDSNVGLATPASLSRMYGRYGVGQICVVSAFYNLKADPKPALEVTLQRIGQAAPPVHMSYTIHSTETPDALMARASNDIARLLYKQQTTDPNKIEFDRLKEITARVNTSDIREWEALRRKLLARGNIVGVRLTSVSFYETTMVITFKGTPDMLGKTLVASGLRVMEDGDSLVLALR